MAGPCRVWGGGLRGYGQESPRPVGLQERLRKADVEEKQVG